MDLQTIKFGQIAQKNVEVLKETDNDKVIVKSVLFKKDGTEVLFDAIITPISDEIKKIEAQIVELESKKAELEKNITIKEGEDDYFPVKK